MLSQILWNYGWINENFFLRNTMAFMACLFLGFVLLVILNRKDIMRFLGTKRKTILPLILIFLLGFYLRNCNYNYGIHTDGYVYAESAKFMVEKGLFVKDCAVGNLESCRLYEQVLFPPGYPFMIALTYMLTGINSMNASVISAMLSSLTTILVFMIARHLFRNDEVGLFSALIFALFPLDLLFANTSNVRPASLFFISLVMMFYLISLKNGKVRSWCLTSIALSLSIYMRQENAVLVVPMVIGLFASGYLRGKSPYDAVKEFWAPFAILLFTQIPLQEWILFSNYMGGSGLFSVQGFLLRAPSILLEMFYPLSSIYYSYDFGYLLVFNPLVTLMFFFTLRKRFRKKWEVLLMWSLFLSYFIVSSAYYWGPSAMTSLDYVRFLQPLALPVSVLSGAFLSHTVRRFGMRKKYLFIMIAVALFVTGMIPVSHGIFADARKEVPSFSGTYYDAIEKIPDNCTVISSMYMAVTSDAIHDNSRRAINTWLIYDWSEAYVREELNESTCVFYIEDMTCEESEEYPCEFIRELEKEYAFKVSGRLNALRVYRVSGNH